MNHADDILSLPRLLRPHPLVPAKRDKENVQCGSMGKYSFSMSLFTELVRSILPDLGTSITSVQIMHLPTYPNLGSQVR